jgi:hypothetical protein
MPILFSGPIQFHFLCIKFFDILNDNGLHSTVDIVLGDKEHFNTAKVVKLKCLVEGYHNCSNCIGLSSSLDSM